MRSSFNSRRLWAVDLEGSVPSLQSLQGRIFLTEDPSAQAGTTAGGLAEGSARSMRYAEFTQDIDAFKEPLESTGEATLSLFTKKINAALSAGHKAQEEMEDLPSESHGGQSVRGEHSLCDENESVLHDLMQYCAAMGRDLASDSPQRRAAHLPTTMSRWGRQPTTMSLSPRSHRSFVATTPCSPGGNLLKDAVSQMLERTRPDGADTFLSVVQLAKHSSADNPSREASARQALPAEGSQVVICEPPLIGAGTPKRDRDRQPGIPRSFKAQTAARESGAVKERAYIRERREMRGRIAKSEAKEQKIARAQDKRRYKARCNDPTVRQMQAEWLTLGASAGRMARWTAALEHHRRRSEDWRDLRERRAVLARGLAPLVRSWRRRRLWGAVMQILRVPGVSRVDKDAAADKIVQCLRLARTNQKKQAKLHTVRAFQAKVKFLQKRVRHRLHTKEARLSSLQMMWADTVDKLRKELRHANVPGFTEKVALLRSLTAECQRYAFQHAHLFKSDDADKAWAAKLVKKHHVSPHLSHWMHEHDTLYQTAIRTAERTSRLRTAIMQTVADEKDREAAAAEENDRYILPPSAVKKLLGVEFGRRGRAFQREWREWQFQVGAEAIFKEMEKERVPPAAPPVCVVQTPTSKASVHYSRVLSALDESRPTSPKASKGSSQSTRAFMPDRRSSIMPGPGHVGSRAQRPPRFTWVLSEKEMAELILKAVHDSQRTASTILHDADPAPARARASTSHARGLRASVPHCGGRRITMHGHEADWSRASFRQQQQAH